MKNLYEKELEVKIGDVIACKGYQIKIAKILSQDTYFYQGEPIYDVEFQDGNGEYHHWKSNLDGGYVIRN